MDCVSESKTVHINVNSISNFSVDSFFSTIGNSDRLALFVNCNVRFCACELKQGVFFGLVQLTLKLAIFLF